MAFLYTRSKGRVEIRESVATPRGPRSRTLASFTGPLTAEVLDRAAERARGRFDRAALRRRARALGIPIRAGRREPEARRLLARLRRGEPLDPVMAGLLRTALDGVNEEPVPKDLAEVAEWLGATPRERGIALYDLMEMYDRIARSRTLPRERSQRRFPRISSSLVAA